MQVCNTTNKKGNNQYVILSGCVWLLPRPQQHAFNGTLKTLLSLLARLCPHW